MLYFCQVQENDFDISDELHTLHQLASQSDCSLGAVSSFIGYVRADKQNTFTKQNPVTHLLLQHYSPMTEQALEHIAQQARQQWPIAAIHIIHRTGKIAVNEQIVLVICASAKRLAALAGCEYIIHQLKVNAPFWKKHIYSDGSSEWLKQDPEDSHIANRMIQQQSKHG